MRIALDARYLTASASGIGTYTDNLARELLALDPDLELLLVTRGSGVAGRFDAARCREVVFDVEPRSFRTVYLLPLWLRRHAFDVFHGPFNILPSGLGRPTAVTIHDIMQLQNPANIATSRLVRQTAGRFWRVRITHAIRRADRILTVSAATRDAILERFPEIPEGRIRVAPNGTDPFFGETVDSAACERARALVGSDGPFVLCVGNESPHKNHYRAVGAFMAAFGDGSPLRFVLVRRSVRHDPRMRALLRRPEVAARTTVLGHVGKEELRALYHLARIFFFPSWVEGFGLPILEAMACGCPVLTSDRSAPCEVSGDAALLASPFSVDEMAAALRQLDGDERLRAELIERGHERVKAFTWERCARETLAAYRQLANDPQKVVDE